MHQDSIEVIPIIIGHTNLPRATGSVTLVRTQGFTLLVDCGDPWNGEELREKLIAAGTASNQITHVVITHGHIDHCGNVNMFPQAAFFMARDIASNQTYSELKENKKILFPDVELHVFSGHTDCDLVILVKNTKYGTVAITGDIFENEHDEESYVEFSQYPERQAVSRMLIKQVADFIVPGHGPIFSVRK